MSSNILLISPQIIKDRSGLHTNVDDKLIRPEIKAMQDLYIMPTLGSTLFNLICDEIEAGTLADPRKYLIDTYVIDCLMNYVLFTLPTALNNQFYNKGVSNSPNETTNNANSNQENLTVNNQYRVRAEFYKERLKRYLTQNAPTLFPQYNSYVAGIDVVQPERSTFTLPIYLGSHGCEDRKPNASYNECKDC
jgi:hypothetical protein